MSGETDLEEMQQMEDEKQKVVGIMKTGQKTEKMRMNSGGERGVRGLSDVGN